MRAVYRSDQPGVAILPDRGKEVGEEAALDARTVEVGQAQDHGPDPAALVRGEHQVFLFLALLPLERVRLARMALVHTRALRPPEHVEGPDEEQTIDAFRDRRVQHAAHEDRVQVKVGIGAMLRVLGGTRAKSGRCSGILLARPMGWEVPCTATRGGAEPL